MPILNKNLYFQILLENYKIWQHWALGAIASSWIWVLASPFERDVVSPGARVSIISYRLYDSEAEGQFPLCFLHQIFIHSCYLSDPCKHFSINLQFLI